MPDPTAKRSRENRSGLRWHDYNETATLEDVRPYMATSDLRAIDCAALFERVWSEGPTQNRVAGARTGSRNEAHDHEILLLAAAAETVLPSSPRGSAGAWRVALPGRGDGQNYPPRVRWCLRRMYRLLF